MRTSDFDYELPQDLIAQTPASKRDGSKLMVLDAGQKTIEHKKFPDIIDYLHKGDLLVLNDTKVLPAQIEGIKEGGTAKIHVLLLGTGHCPVRTGRIQKCLVKPGKRLKVGSRIIFGKGELIGTVLEKTGSGEQIIEFKGNLEKFMKRNGKIPLPPYIKSETLNSKQAQNSKSKLSKRYQTVYADKLGASAAPTAGLHFTKKLLSKIKKKGIKIAYVTLHTGLDTFRPVYAENIEEHKMHSESFEVPEETREAIKKARRVIAVGTTTVRALESNSPLTPLFSREGKTNLFIKPGYKFKVIDAMITNFHFPRTTLLMMVSAFAGREFILDAYREAILKHYRFFSFGDAMFIR
ncbi:tRNA preQ1(34) S-adenosylmethionine ribosyltransferase-isomerase QueA [candidate division WOR-1 bacterium RIFOXYA12_FULL_43_27]|uniref:S-adenosylmethionine:tRNA ribosyltransferase-isomerase n=1 Tax=candidate division WOR-1 bacterium RIFOXYC2_FULL_46_14 TaxID=1802587 RepID=A0A1F4U4U5_UNCSA|nr:MAG: tRNA preQ1(34) S-adenosylmethionine ribosyltransferase-isomerase QueA [candidate division WOR-1 bacterium RIFOXYA12_FULL_43_27]OGC20718.1 MAG: tRNA preQ1(34) S-adenosylmethionine ribosyltransferase-isomerase QueA [candidate division WOR-1 bacterium RIFOXYB2_FULL_46_45]OGC31545.1 MAG: tRNA preQ1(34) S-adenosylmethionine ribosyltransferase-isomerase QueA [candidate division WOR-1 bacterium RIFOXYA2_FULL_46_56]OGC39952.1 MAG: tRNA preQ1(34) S-adenosylmethionine ribosyltransferase-isomerase 